MGKVLARAWEQPEEVWEVIGVQLAVNGVLEVIVKGASGESRKCAWWKYKSERAESLYEWIDELSTLPGWKGPYRDVIFQNLEDRRSGRMLRQVTSRVGSASQGKGSYMRGRSASS